MLFICYATIDPDDRDESAKRFQEQTMSDLEGGQIVGGWMALTQQEAWCVIEADSAEAVLKVLEPWTDLNINQVMPVIAFEDYGKFLGAQD